MALPDLKEFCLPSSDSEALETLDRYGDSALIVAGGTFIHGLEARGFLSGTEALVDLRKLGLDKIHADKTGLHVGATAKFIELKNQAALSNPGYGALRDALNYPPAQILNLATVGGSIAAACPFFDVPTAFHALDGEVLINGRGGEQRRELGAMYAGLFENTLEAGQYIAGLWLPQPDKNTGSAYLKLETNANDLALVGVAVRFSLGWRGKISDARVVLGGGLNDNTVRSAAAEAVLNGNKPDAALFEQAALAIGDCINPISDHRCSAEYRTHIGQVYVKRALATAQQRINGEAV